MDIKIPQVGESVFEATIAKWHKKNGDAVEEDDLLCELETDKITLELNAETSGRLSIKVEEGETVKIGTVIGAIEEGKAGEKKPAEKKEKDEKERVEKEEKKEREEKEKEKEKEGKKEKGREEKKEDGGKKEGEETGEKKKEPPSPATAPPPVAPVTDERITRRPMTPIRRKIAERLVAVRQQSAMLTTFNEADLSRVNALRDKHRESFREKHGVGLGLMSFFVKACVEALREFPQVNARIEGEDIVFHHFYNIGIAVGSEKGLVVPVLKDADRMHFDEIEKGIQSFVEKIKSNKLELSDLEGGTFTISNGGVYGSLLSTPMLNPPQSAVLGMHAIKDRPVALEGKIEIRPMMYLALSYDHRLIDGRESVNFLKRIVQLVEEPEEMLLDL